MVSVEKELVKVEGNLIEYPFFSYSKRTRENITSKSYEFGEIILPDGSKQKKSLIIAAPLGIPTGYDQDVLIAILRIGTRDQSLIDRIFFTLYEVAEIMGSPDNESLIKKSIRRLTATTYFARHSVLVKGENSDNYLEEIREDGFHIINEYKILDRKEKNKRLSRGVTYVKLNSIFIENFVNGYFKYIDWSKYLELETPVAKKLFLYLEKKKFRKEIFEIGIDKLALAIPIESEYSFKIKSTLKSANDRLVKNEVIDGYDFGKGKVIYYFPKHDGVRSPGAGVIAEAEEREIVEKLVETGVTETVAKKLVREHPVEKVRSQLDCLSFRKGDNVPGILVKAVSEDWAPPHGYLRKKKGETKAGEMERERSGQKEEERVAFQEKVKGIISGLDEEKKEDYRRRAEEIFRSEAPHLKHLKMPEPYREGVVKRLVAEDMGIPVVV